MSKLWGSRFEKKTDKLADQFTFSIGYDQRLAKYDVLGSIAHAKMLGKVGIISKEETKILVAGLTKLLNKIVSGKFEFDPKAEDVHTNIQSALKSVIGDTADKLHTARSRNDLVVLDMKMYCLDELNQITKAVTDLQKTVVRFANRYKSVIIPAYTHLQQAQVVLLGHHALAYVEMLERDKGRLMNNALRTNTMPLGSCALSGTSLPIDRSMVARELKFANVSRNSIDSVSDRDFIVEMISNIAIAGMHLSRMAEDLIIWASQEFNYIDIDSAYCTGSSIMPHKKNPDVLELIRGESASLSSHVTEILMLTKSLPLTYNRDLQLDKPPLFASVEKIKAMLELTAKIFSTLKVNKNIIKERIQNESLFSVDVMEHLIKKGVSYRDAHDTVGKIIKSCIDKGSSISELTEAQLKKFSPELSEDVKKLLNPEMSVKIKKSVGSTNPNLVNQQINQWKKKLHA